MAHFSLNKIQISILTLLFLNSINSFSSDAKLAGIKAKAIQSYLSSEYSAPSSEALHSVHVYIGNGAESFVIQAAKIQIDDAEPVRYIYSEMESRALLAGGLHVISSADLASGEHRIRAEFVAMAGDGGPNTDRVFPTIDQQVNVSEETHIELQLFSDGMKKVLGKAELVLHEWRPTL